MFVKKIHVHYFADNECVIRNAVILLKCPPFLLAFNKVFSHVMTAVIDRLVLTRLPELFVNIISEHCYTVVHLGVT